MTQLKGRAELPAQILLEMFGVMLSWMVFATCDIFDRQFLELPFCSFSLAPQSTRRMPLGKTSAHSLMLRR
jgi:hypothetical protein